MCLRPGGDACVLGAAERAGNTLYGARQERRNAMPGKSESSKKGRIADQVINHMGGDIMKVFKIACASERRLKEQINSSNNKTVDATAPNVWFRDNLTLRARSSLITTAATQRSIPPARQGTSLCRVMAATQFWQR